MEILEKLKLLKFIAICFDMTSNCYLLKWLAYTLNHLEFSQIQVRFFVKKFLTSFLQSTILRHFCGGVFQNQTNVIVCYEVCVTTRRVRHLYGEDLTGLKETQFQIVWHEMNLKIMSSNKPHFCHEFDSGSSHLFLNKCLIINPIMIISVFRNLHEPLSREISAYGYIIWLRKWTIWYYYRCLRSIWGHLRL